VVECVELALGTTMYRPLDLGGPMTDPQVQQAVG
jgi:hypothetical protein